MALVPAVVEDWRPLVVIEPLLRVLDERLVVLDAPLLTADEDPIAELLLPAYLTAFEPPFPV